MVNYGMVAPVNEINIFSTFTQSTSSKVTSIVRCQDPTRWKDLVFRVFDTPSKTLTYEKRMKLLQTLNLPSHVELVSQTLCKGW